jgi:hypothetical protein
MKTTQNAIVASFSCDILYAITYHFFGDWIVSSSFVDLVVIKQN